jgi:hypothetical protein
LASDAAVAALGRPGGAIGAGEGVGRNGALATTSEIGSETVNFPRYRNAANASTVLAMTAAIRKPVNERLLACSGEVEFVRNLNGASTWLAMAGSVPSSWDDAQAEASAKKAALSTEPSVRGILGVMIGRKGALMRRQRYDFRHPAVRDRSEGCER